MDVYISLLICTLLVLIYIIFIIKYKSNLFKYKSNLFSFDTYINSSQNTFNEALAETIMDVDNGKVIKINILNQGNGYTKPPEIIFNGIFVGKPAKAVAVIENSKIVDIILIDGGQGYTSPPTISFKINQYDPEVIMATLKEIKDILKPQMNVDVNIEINKLTPQQLSQYALNYDKIITEQKKQKQGKLNAIKTQLNHIKSHEAKRRYASSLAKKYGLEQPPEYYSKDEIASVNKQFTELNAPAKTLSQHDKAKCMLLYNNMISIQNESESLNNKSQSETILSAKAKLLAQQATVAKEKYTNYCT